MKLKSTSILDILGISSATICMAHCLALPILSILPIALLHNYWIDIAFACIGLFVVSKIVFSDAPNKVKAILGVSIILVMVGVVLELVIGADYWLILIGGSGMVVGHLLNFRCQHFKYS